MSINTKIQTAYRVLHTFGPLELVRLTLRKLSDPKKRSRKRFGLQGVQIIKVSEFTDDFLSLLLRTSAREILLARRQYVIYLNRFNQRIMKPRESFFNPIYDLGPGMSEFIFLSVVIKKPQLVIETGVAAGVSTDSILNAIQFNKSGSLLSVDVTKKVGELIDSKNKRRWKLEVLPMLNREKRFIEILRVNNRARIFLHDSDHSPSWQIKEFSHVVRYLPEIDLILFDDISQELVNLIINKYRNFQVVVIDEIGKYSAIITRW